MSVSIKTRQAYSEIDEFSGLLNKEQSYETVQESVDMVEYKKDNILVRLKNFIKNIFK